MTLANLKDSSRETRFNFELTFDPDPEKMADEDKPPQMEGEDEDDYWERIWEWENQIRRAVQPEPNDFTEPAEDLSTGDEFMKGKTGLQVIVKLANIELTPEKPAYAGGTWHVEGQLVSNLDSHYHYCLDTDCMSNRMSTSALQHSTTTTTTTSQKAISPSVNTFRTKMSMRWATLKMSTNGSMRSSALPKMVLPSRK